jgi:hypothetical protein
MEAAPLPYGAAALLPAHEIEDRLAVLNVRRILSSPKAMKVHRDAQKQEAHTMRRARLAEAVATLDLMKGG